MGKFESMTQKDLDNLMKHFNDRLERNPKLIVTEKEVYKAIGLENGRDDFGWGNGQGFHKLTLREMNPDFCPCCGRPWDEASEKMEIDIQDCTSVTWDGFCLASE